MHRKVNSTSSVSSTMLVSARYLTNMFYIGLSLKSLEQNCFLQHLQYFQWALEGGVKGGSSMQHMAGRQDSAGSAFRPFQLPGVIMFGVEPSERRSGRASPASHLHICHNPYKYNSGLRALVMTRASLPASMPSCLVCPHSSHILHSLHPAAVEAG